VDVVKTGVTPSDRRWIHLSQQLFDS